MNRIKERPSYGQLEDRKLLAADFLLGTGAAETITTEVGQQTVYAGAGDDVLVSLGDAGEPIPAQGGEVITPRRSKLSNDLFIGGDGADTFKFMPLINAKQDIYMKHFQSDGTIDWTGDGVAGENDSVHAHWVEGIGADTIVDFESGVDSILIEGHTATASVTTVASIDGVHQYSQISIFSDQGGAGAHDGDYLGIITVYGDAVQESDLTVDPTVFHSVDLLDEWVQPELDEAVEVETAEGGQTEEGGNGADTFVSLGDDGEPESAATGERQTSENQVDANDEYFGGYGDDEFEFVSLIDGTDENVLANTDADGNVDWAGVAGNNDSDHAHWTTGIGNDVIHDFQSGNDRIVVRGHEVGATVNHLDSDGDGVDDYSVIDVFSEDGAVHDGDDLGSITVYGDLVEDDDLTVDRNATDGVDRLPGWEAPTEDLEQKEIYEQIRLILQLLTDLLSRLG